MYEFQGGEVLQETISSNISDDTVVLEYQNSDGTLITQFIDFKRVSFHSSEHKLRNLSLLFLEDVENSKITDNLRKIISDANWKFCSFSTNFSCWKISTDERGYYFQNVEVFGV